MPMLAILRKASAAEFAGGTLASAAWSSGPQTNVARQYRRCVRSLSASYHHSAPTGDVSLDHNMLETTRGPAAMALRST
jgi:hypothetical protein